MGESSFFLNSKVAFAHSRHSLAPLTPEVIALPSSQGISLELLLDLERPNASIGPSNVIAHLELALSRSGHSAGSGVLGPGLLVRRISARLLDGAVPLALHHDWPLLVVGFADSPSTTNGGRDVIDVWLVGVVVVD